MKFPKRGLCIYKNYIYNFCYSIFNNYGLRENPVIQVFGDYLCKEFTEQDFEKSCSIVDTEATLKEWVKNYKPSEFQLIKFLDNQEPSDKLTLQEKILWFIKKTRTKNTYFLDNRLECYCSSLRSAQAIYAFLYNVDNTITFPQVLYALYELVKQNVQPSTVCSTIHRRVFPFLIKNYPSVYTITHRNGFKDEFGFATISEWEIFNPAKMEA